MTVIESGSRRSGVVLILTAAVFWSFSGVCVKSMPGVNPLLITGYRSILAFLMMAGYFLRVAGGITPASVAVHRALGFRRAWGSACCYGMMLVLFISATRYTTAANAILLQYAAPMYVALLSVPILGEPVRRREWITLAGCFCGVLLFFGEKLSVAGFWGNILAVLSGVACALNAVFMRSLTQIREKTEPGEVVVAATVNGKISPAFPAIILGNMLTVCLCLPWMIQTGEITAKSWGIIAFMGVFQLGLPYILFTIGISRLAAVEVMILAMTEAVLNPVWTALGAGEYPSAVACAGGVLILVSVGIYGWLKN
jgi:drug/metabolite transporter (DMT)-like permease